MDDERSEAMDEGPFEEEVVEGVIVLAEDRTVEPLREGPPPFVTVAAVAATSFVAGAATAAMLGRRLGRTPARGAAAVGPVAPSLPSASAGAATASSPRAATSSTCTPSRRGSARKFRGAACGRSGPPA